ncbi:MAG: DUF4349 domain-containing protein [Clostridia bacterium]|nr:DUF4349 domain-containing protein [Clostridia bacterium]
MKRFFKYLCLITLTLLCLGLFACGESYDNSGGAEIGGTETNGSAVLPDALDRKIVYNAYLDIETDEITAAKKALDEKCVSLGGYVESTSEDYEDNKCTYAYVTYRIPTAKLNEFLATAEQGGEMKEKSIYSNDITTSYVNATAKKEALQEQKALLENMLNDSSISASDRVSIIKEIADINTQLKEIDLLITQYDSMVDYSTVRITIEEPVSSPFIPIIIVACVFTAVGLFSAIFFPLFFIKRSKKNADN